MNIIDVKKCPVAKCNTGKKDTSPVYFLKKKKKSIYSSLTNVAVKKTDKEIIAMIPMNIPACGKVMLFLASVCLSPCLFVLTFSNF